jgi:hypothetical protein
MLPATLQKHALTTPLDPFNLESREAPWRKLGRRTRLACRVGGRLEIHVAYE